SKSGKGGASLRSRDLDEDDPDDDEDERPRKRGKGGRKQEKGAPVLLFVGLGGGGLLLVGGVVVALVLLLGGKKETKADNNAARPGGPQVGGPAVQPRGHDSPQAVFDAWQAAIKNKDAKQFVACMSPTARREAAAEIA